MPVIVNRLPIEELRQQLMLVPRLSVVAAEAIMRLRPFSDRADLRARVNEAVGVPHEFVGPKLVDYFDFAPADGGAQPARTRNAEHARELLALNVVVPWSAWDGYADHSGQETGMVWDYDPFARRFIVRFPPHAECNDIGMTWEELKGDLPCLSSATERAKLDEEPNTPPMDFTPQPRGSRPRDAVWDQRKGAWVDCTGSDYDPGTFARSRLKTHIVPAARSQIDVSVPRAPATFGAASAAGSLSGPRSDIAT